MRRTLRYVEPLSEERTLLVDFFSILGSLDAVEAQSFQTLPTSVLCGVASPPRSHYYCFFRLGLSTGCSPSVNRYLLIEQSLLAGDPQRAAAIVEQAQKEYGTKGRLLYDMDRGMVLQLAGQYRQSSEALEQAEEEVERLYTRTIRSETAAFLTNDNVLPYEGDAYEHVLINVIKALNCASQGQLQEALVEARRIDHRLNVLSDRVKETSKYRNDGFARYLSGILYEATGDLNNAFIAYRNAYEAYRAMSGWLHIPSLRLCAQIFYGQVTRSASRLSLANIDRHSLM